ncbi:prepilin peptidase [Chitinibacteraceae bacterium HSL-7]
MEFWTSQPAAFSAAVTLLGLLIGSFLNVVIHRLPIMIERAFRHECSTLDMADPTQAPEPPEKYNLVVPRSACPACGHAIGALENIPVISYVLQKGRCKGCGTRISPRYPAVEVLTAVLSGAVAWHFGPTLAGAAALLLTWSLIALVFIDADTYLLPDSITLPLLWQGLLLNLQGTFTSLPNAVVGAAAGYLSLWSVYWLFKLLTGKEGMGFGDFKLLAALGAWFGWQLLPSIILLSSLAGVVIGISQIVLGQRARNKPIPFGPYLGIAGWLVLMMGDVVQRWVFSA